MEITQYLQPKRLDPSLAISTASQLPVFTLAKASSEQSQSMSDMQPVVLEPDFDTSGDNNIDEDDLPMFFTTTPSQESGDTQCLESFLLHELQQFNTDELRRLERALNKLTEFWKTETDVKNASDMLAILLKIADIQRLVKKAKRGGIPVQYNSSETVLPPDPGLAKCGIGIFNIVAAVCTWIHDLEANEEVNREVAPLIAYCGTTDESKAKLSAQERVYHKKGREVWQRLAFDNGIKTASATTGLISNTANHVANQLPSLFPSDAVAEVAPTLGTVSTYILPVTIMLNTASFSLSTYKSLKAAWKAGKTLGRQNCMKQSLVNHPVDEFAARLNWDENPQHSQTYVFLMDVIDHAIKRNLRFTIIKSIVTYVTSASAAGSSLGAGTLTGMAIMAGGMAYIAWVIPAIAIVATALPAGFASLAWYLKKKTECYQARKLFRETEKTAKIVAMLKVEIEELKSKPLTLETVKKINFLTDHCNKLQEKLLDQINEFMEETEKEIAREYATLIADPKFDNDPNTEVLIAYLKERTVGTGIVSEEIFNATIGLVKDLYPDIKKAKANIKIQEKIVQELEKELERIELYPANSQGLALREQALALQIQIQELEDDLKMLKTFHRKNKVIGGTWNIDPAPIKEALQNAQWKLREIKAAIKTHKQEVKKKIDLTQWKDIKQKIKETQEKLEVIKKEKKNIEKMCDNLIMWLCLKL